MKKTIAIILMLILALSITPVYAANDDIRVEATTVDGKKIDITGNVVIRGVSEFGKERRDDAEKFREQLKEANSEDKKALVRQKVSEIRQDFNLAKERFKEQKQELKQSRQVFKDSKQKIRECKESDNEDCKQARHNGKNFLLSTVNTMLDLQAQALARLEASEEFEGKVEIKAQIEADMQVLTEIKLKIENLGDNPTREELKIVAAELREYWKNNKQHLRFSVEKVLNLRMSGIIEKTEHLETKLNRVLEKLKEKGYDTTKAEEKIVEFNEHITTAKAEHQIAVQLIAEARVNYDKEKLTQAHEHLKTAHQELKEAHDILKEVVREIKAVNEGEEVLEEVDNEETEEISDEPAEDTDDEEATTINTETTADTQVEA